MKDSKLVKKAKKLKAKNPTATTGQIFGALADEAADENDPVARESLGVAGATDVIKQLRKRAGLR
jgi:hypothetical protein